MIIYGQELLMRFMIISREDLLEDNLREYMHGEYNYRLMPWSNMINSACTFAGGDG